MNFAAVAAVAAAVDKYHLFVCVHARTHSRPLICLLWLLASTLSAKLKYERVCSEYFS